MKIGIPGIQRKSQREKFHVKDLFCCTCQEETKHVEIRYCDWIDEVMEKAEELHREYYQSIDCFIRRRIYGSKRLFAKENKR